MSIEPAAPIKTPSEASAWRRLVTWVSAWERAMDTTHDDLQDGRILTLERDVAELKQQRTGPLDSERM